MVKNVSLGHMAYNAARNARVMIEITTGIAIGSTPKIAGRTGIDLMGVGEW